MDETPSGEKKQPTPKRATIIALVLGAAGIITGWWGIEILLYYRIFTETAVGKVEKWDGETVIIQFQNGSAQEKVYFTKAFPKDQRTERLIVGDTVNGHHPPKGLTMVSLDREFSYLLPSVAVVVGVVCVVASGAVLLLPPRSRQKSTDP